MARYCFYCGRELAPDETCDCRARGASGSATGTGAGAGASKPGGASSGTKKSAPPPPPPPRPKPPKPPKPPKRPRAPGTAGLYWKARGSEAVGFLTRPAQTIRRIASCASRGATAAYLLLSAAVAAVAAAALAGRASAQGFLAFLLTGGISWLGAGADLATPGLRLVPVVFAAVLAQYLVLAGLFALALRFLLRTPTPYVRVLSAAAPAAFYMSVLTLLALLSSLGAAMPATHLLLAGAVLGYIAWFLGLSSVTGQGEDRTFSLLLFVLFLFAALMAAVAGALPAAFPAAALPSGTGGAF